MERRWIFLGIAAVIVLLASAGDYGAGYASEETAVRVSGAELAAKQIQDWIVSLMPSRPGLWAVVR
jgi:hypothetical protein